jgi:hypothetical protein
MVTTEECRRLAAQCQQWAEKADSEATRVIFLQLSRDLTPRAIPTDDQPVQSDEEPDTVLERHIADIRSLYREVV